MVKLTNVFPATTTTTTTTLCLFAVLLPIPAQATGDLFGNLASFLCLLIPFLPYCNRPWPSSPLLQSPTNDPNWVPPATLEEAKTAMVGHYAHFDTVAYYQDMFTGPFRSFIISYGFTDFFLEDNKLIQVDSFCFSEYKANTPFETSVSDAFTQSITPRQTEVNVYLENGIWNIYRPATPVLTRITGDASLPLSSNPDDPNIIDADGDGNPGVTAELRLYGFLSVDMYIARRDIFQDYLTLYSDGSLRGYVVDDSEQLRIGSTLDFLFDLTSKPYDYPLQERDPGLNPIVLTPTSVSTCDELKAQRDTIFPPSPHF